MAFRALCTFVLSWFFSSTSTASVSECGLNLCDENANCTNPGSNLASGCECNAGWAAEDAESWFEGKCFFQSGSYPTGADETWRTNSSSYFDISQTLLQKDAIIVSKVVFPTVARDGMLLQIGGARIGLWVGILDGKFHIQAGKGGTLYCGMRYAETAYLITELYPLDGQAHTVIIDFEFTNEGRIQLWIDGARIGGGIPWSTGAGTAWAQSQQGAYGLPSATKAVVDVDAGWPGDILSDLVVYSDSPRVGGCVAVSCVDVRVDECATEQDNCHSAAFCADTAGSFTCSCNAGYSGNGTECLNIDECVSGDNNCHSLAVCHDTVGSFFCSCNAGYKKDASVGNESCFDVDECLTKEHDCDLHATCSNVAGSFTCACNIGFFGSGITVNKSASTGQLESISAIFTTAPPGNENSTLKETAAPFELMTATSYLQSETPSPVVFDGCADLDECAAGDHNCDTVQATCANSIGSFTCTCDAGWESNNSGVVCTDIVDCGVADNCDANAACADADGSFTCTCNAGYSGNGTMDGCYDADECAAGNHNCDTVQATCANSIGSFTCTCDAGWESNNSGVVCTDIVDCGVADNCDANAACADADGSFTCTCNTGWVTVFEGGSWFEGNCFFEDGTYPSTSLSDVALRHPASSDFNVNKALRLADAIFVCKVVFPTTTEDAMLFEIGGSNALWVGVLNGSFHMQVGNPDTPVVGGMVYDETAYMITNNFPTDGLNHTVVIDLGFSTQGSLRLWIDDAYIGEGVQWTSTAQSLWAGSNNAAYGVETSTTLPVGVVGTGWKGTVSSDLLIYSLIQRVGGCVTAQCSNVDECATSAHTCGANAMCDDTEGSFNCVCNNGWEHNYLGWFGEGCAFDDGTISPALPSVALQQEASDSFFLSQSIRKKDVVFACQVVFPFTVQDGLLFEFGGTGDGVWAGILNGKFHFQAGSGEMEVHSEDGPYPSTAYLVTESFPTDNKTHTVLIDFELSNFGRTRLWIDGDYIGEGVRMTSSSLEQWAGSNDGAYGHKSSSPVVAGATETGWSGAVLSDLVIYSDMRVGGCQRCIDIDECSVGSHNCDANSVCNDNDGSFSCTCAAGWDGNGTFCTNVDECDIGFDNCDDNATCSDTAGSFVCACDGPHWLDSGAGDGTKCEMDECVMEVDNCDFFAQCNNTNGSFTCACDTGFIADSPLFDGSRCADIDECANGSHECDPHAECSNTNGSYTCTCMSGWQSGSWFEEACLYDDGSYPDVDSADFRTAEAIEFRLDDHIRKNSAIFACKVVFPSVVQDGRLFAFGDWSFKMWVGILDGRFRIQVGTGYNAITDGALANNAAYMITDSFPTDDEPHTVLIEMDNNNYRAIRLWFDNTYIGEGVQQRYLSTGSNWAGSSPGGAYGNVTGGVGMRDRPNATTSAWPGAIWSDLIIHKSSTRIGGCEEGLCVNVDECADELHNCGAGAVCADNVGSFACDCVAGYEEWAIANVSCADIDECADGSHVCHERATCVNKDGSYTCSCHAGWTAESWLHGSCWFSDGTYPDLTLGDVTLRTSETSTFEVSTSIRSSPAIFVCRVTFPKVVQNGRLFAIGSNSHKLWVGILDGKFRIQAGRAYSAISDGTVADNTAYLITDEFPSDGMDHTLVIDMASTSYGSIRLWIDNVYIGEGMLSRNQQLSGGWGGNGPGIYGSESGGPIMRNTNGSTDGWQGKVLSDLMIYSNTKRVGGCDEGGPQCTVNVDECAAALHDCVSHASCSDTVGSFACTCDVGYAGIGNSSCSDVDECAENLQQCDANARCNNTQGSYTCECMDGWQQAAWFEGDCFFEDGSYPDLTSTNGTLLLPRSSEFEVDVSVRQLSAIFACKVVFPTTTEDAMLFEIGGDLGDGGIWAGVMDGKFHVQAGDEHAVDDSSTWADTVWVRSDAFPQDGKAHTVLIDLEWRSGGWMRVWIDSTLIGEGRLAFAMRRWAGHDPGAFGMTTASDVVIGAAFNGWHGPVLSDLMIYVNATKRVGGCDADTCANVDECAAALHDCVSHASCSDTVGSFSCTCDVGYAGIGNSSCSDVDECAENLHQCDANARCNNTQGSYTCECIPESWFEGNCFFEDGSYPLAGHSDATMQIPVSPSFDVEESVRTSDAIFVCKVVFPTTTEDAMLFEIGGSNALWVGVLNGSFHIQAGSPDTLVAADGTSHQHVAYMIVEDFPQDGLPHTIVIDLNVTAQGRIRLWVDNMYHGEGVPWTSSTKSRWGGSNNGAFGVAASTKVPFGSVGTGWMGVIVSDLIIYAGTAGVGGCGQDAACVNVDECALGMDSCGSSSNCADTAGSFECTCAAGWSIADDHIACENINECGASNTCHTKATCADSEGSFTCTCNVGYEGDGVACVDADECADASACDASSKEACFNVDGSFACVCQQGFSGSPSDNVSCVDVDECATDTHDCDSHSTCHNLNGGYYCDCEAGWADHRSWFDGNCFFDDGSYPDLTSTDYGATLRVSATSAFTASEAELPRTSNVVFVAEAIFPITVQDGMLFEVGGGGQGMWVGILNERFHVQAGEADTEVVDGASYAEIAYLITDSFPRDGENHTVVIDLEFGFKEAAGGRIRLWIDSAYIGAGHAWTSGSTTRWAGYNTGAYGLTSSSIIVPGATSTGWPASLGSDLFVYSGTRLVGDCLERGECVNVDECLNGWDTCGNSTTCSDTDGSFVCVHDVDNAEAAASVEASSMRADEVEGSNSESTANNAAMSVVIGVGTIILLGAVRWHFRRRRQQLSSDGLSDVCFAQPPATSSIQQAAGPITASDVQNLPAMGASAESELESNPRAPPQLEWTRSRSSRLSSKSLALPSPLSLVSSLSPQGGSFKRVITAMRKPSRASAEAYDVASGASLLGQENDET